MRLLVTRPQPQADAWVERLRACGFDALALPLIEIRPPADPAAVHAAWRSLDRRALVVFVSPSAAESFVAARPPDGAWPAALEAASIGPGTARALRDAGIGRIVEPPADALQFDSEALWTQLEARDWRGRSVLIVRGDGGREWLADRMRAAGAAVDMVAAYSRSAARLDAMPGAELLREALRRPEAHRWLFSSSEAIGHLAAAAPQADWGRAHALATHPRIAARARALGIDDVIETRATFDAVVSALGR
jgi:uroporphyrinogen-III synthase